MTDGFVKMETENYKFFQHKACEFFPCHETKDIDNFNCLLSALRAGRKLRREF